MKCPYCGSKKVKEVDDKTNVLYYLGDYTKVYGKKYECKDCGWDWKNAQDIRWNRYSS